ncbi:Phosphoinositide phospholipase C [Fasciolopsis buskii]|uniref:Phosphoinositide phospholipase C n=1 Tax=Fasciolopsis buskii TaxID=27845 RepID=A0A8E0VEQ4_9TREM|nr:Phosphoinositide phospholipase C [Fasciolopsis buski]
MVLRVVSLTSIISGMTIFSQSRFMLFCFHFDIFSKYQQYKLAKYCEEILGDMLLTKPIDGFPVSEILGFELNEVLVCLLFSEQLDMFFKGQTDALQEENEVTEDPDLAVDGEGEMFLMSTKFHCLNLPSHPYCWEISSRFTFHLLFTDTEACSRPGNSSSALGDVPTPGTPISVNPSGGGSSADLKRLQMKKVRRLISAWRTSIYFLSLVNGNLTAEEEQMMMAQYHHIAATSSIHPLLSSFVNYAQPVKFQGFDVAEERCLSSHMFSCNENVGLGLIKKDCIGFVNFLNSNTHAQTSYNKRQMSRIYPRGNRVDSSNYMPQIFWNAGCQMVALNFQTPDLAMQLNQGKFEYNGNCGYLLKPEFMRRPERQFDPFSESPMDGVIAATCEVRIISGQFLSDRKVGTYVEVDMYGLPTDTIRKEFRTRVVPNNGLNPVYGDDAVFVFRKVVLPDLAVLRFAVYEDTGKLIGQRVLPLDGLQAGYRHISLRTEGNFPLSLPTLFCRVSLTTYIPEGLNDLVDALSDPRAFLSKEEQRMKQLASMGIDSSEIADVSSTGNVRRSGPGHATSGGPGTVGATASGDSASACVSSAKKDEKKGKFLVVRARRLFMLFLMKDAKMWNLISFGGCTKLVKKQQKELEVIQRRQEKDAMAMLRNHTLVTDKLNTSHAKERSSMKRSTNKENGQTATLEDTQKSQVTLLFSYLMLIFLMNMCRLDRFFTSWKSVSMVLDRRTVITLRVPLQSCLFCIFLLQMCELVRQQTDQWTNLKSTQMKEIYEFVLGYIEARKELLIKIMKEVQEEQKRELRIIQGREVKEMKAQQTKASIESSRSVMNDPKLRNKAERDRRIRELNDYNTKRFIDQRKIQAQRHEKQIQELNKRHAQEEQDVMSSMKKEREDFIRKYEEDLLAVKRATVI